MNATTNNTDYQLSRSTITDAALDAITDLDPEHDNGALAEAIAGFARDVRDARVLSLMLGKLGGGVLVAFVALFVAPSLTRYGFFGAAILAGVGLTCSLFVSSVLKTKIHDRRLFWIERLKKQNQEDAQIFEDLTIRHSALIVTAENSASSSTNPLSDR